MAADAPQIRPALADDGPALARIYNHYIRETVVTFEERPVDGAEMQQRVADLQGQDLPWLVICRSGAVLGYAYAAPWRSRSAYRFSVETTIYLEPSATGQGLGRRLYQALLDQLQNTPVTEAIGGIALDNPASCALHEALGFEKVAHFARVGYKFQRWIDVGYWQRAIKTV